MGVGIISRRSPYTQKILEQLGVYPIGINGLPMGNVILRDNMTSLSRYLFMDNPQVTNVNLPASIELFDDYAFKGVSNLKKIDCPILLEKISNYCFSESTSLAEVSLNENISAIGDYAFNTCTSLRKINYNGITQLTVGKYAFNNCQSFNEDDFQEIAEKLKLPLGEGIFANNQQIENLIVNFVSNKMFENDNNLKQVTILSANDKGELANFIFQDCSSLKKIILPENVITISENAFNINTSNNRKSFLQEINIPNSCTTIGKQAFMNCVSLKNLSLPKSIAVIGEAAFQSADLSNLQVEEGIKVYLNYRAFSNSNINNEAVNIICKEGTTVYSNGYTFSECNNLTDIIIGSKTSQCMFFNCFNLEKVRIKNTATFLHNNMFQRCKKLKEVYIEDGINELGQNVFYECSALETIYLPSTILYWNDNSHSNLNNRYYIFKECTNLKNISLGKNWTQSLYLAVSNNITIDSMKNIFKNLGTVSNATLTLGNINLNKLTDDEEAQTLLNEAKSRGWNIV